MLLFILTFVFYLEKYQIQINNLNNILYSLLLFHDMQKVLYLAHLVSFSSYCVSSIFAFLCNCNANKKMSNQKFASTKLDQFQLSEGEPHQGMVVVCT